MTDRNSDVVIAAVALPPPLHGQSIVNAKVVDGLKDFGANIRVVDLSPGILTRNFLYHGRRIGRILKTLFFLGKHSRFRQKTIYLVAQAGTGVIYSLLIVAMGRLLRYRIVLHHHSRAYIAKKTYLHGLLVMGAGGATTHVVLSEKMRGELVAQYEIPQRSCIVSSNACHIGIGSVGRRKVGARPIRIGLLSNLNREKGLDLAVATACEAVDRGFDLSLVLAGPILGQIAKDTVAQAMKNLGSRIKVLGPVEGATKQEFFEAIDVFLFPSMYRDEAQPLVLLEAMAYGVPLIVSDHGYIQELVGDAAVVLPADNVFPSRAVGAIESWINDHNSLVASGAAARNRFSTLHDLSVHQFGELLKEIGGRNAVD